MPITEGTDSGWFLHTRILGVPYFRQMFVVTIPATCMFVKVRFGVSKRRAFPQGICFDTEDNFLAAGSGLDFGVVGPNERAQPPA